MIEDKRKDPEVPAVPARVAAPAKVEMPAAAVPASEPAPFVLSQAPPMVLSDAKPVVDKPKKVVASTFEGMK